MGIDTPNNDPLSIIPTPKTPEAETQTPEVKKQPTINEVLDEVLKKYNINPEEFEKLGISGEIQGLLQTLKDSLTKENKDINLENLVNEAYQEYVKKKLNKEKVGDGSEFSIDKIGENLNSNRLNKFNDFIDKYFDGQLKKYDFLDVSQKEFFKINIYNQALENGFLNIINTQTGGVNKLFNDIASSNINIDELITEMSSQKEGEPKISIAGFDILNKYLSPCLKKFDEIEELFKTKKITNEKEKQNIFSNIDFFKEVNNFSKISDFNVNTINLTETKKFEGSQNVEQLSEMILKSKDLQEKLSESLAGGAKAEELIYKLSNSELTGQKTSKLMEMLFKIPLFGKMFAGFLGYDTKNPMLDYIDTSKGFGLFDSLTKLGEHKEKNQDGTEKTIEGKGDFKGVKFDIDFTSNKDIFKEIGKTFPELKDKKNYDDFWMNAFGEQGYKQNEKDSFSFQIDNDDFKKLKEDESINQKDFSQLINDGLKKYKEDKSKNQEIPAETPKATAETPKATAETPKATVETPTATAKTTEDVTEPKSQEVKNETQKSETTPEDTDTKTPQTSSVDSGYRDKHGNYNLTPTSSLENTDTNESNNDYLTKRVTLNIVNPDLTKNAVNFLLGYNTDSVLKNNFTGVFGDYYQIKHIRMNEILKGGNNIDLLIKNTIGESDYNDLLKNSSDKLAIIRESIRILNVFIKEKLYAINREYNLSDKSNGIAEQSRNYKNSGLLNSNLAYISTTNTDQKGSNITLLGFLKQYNLEPKASGQS